MDLRFTARGFRADAPTSTTCSSATSRPSGAAAFTVTTQLLRRTSRLGGGSVPMAGPAWAGRPSTVAASCRCRSKSSGTRMRRGPGASATSARVSSVRRSSTSARPSSSNAADHPPGPGAVGQDNEPNAGSDLPTWPPPSSTATSGVINGRRCGRRSRSGAVVLPARPHRPRRTQAKGHSFCSSPMAADGIEISPSCRSPAPPSSTRCSSPTPAPAPTWWWAG
jgi:hypothetical protein